MVSFDKYGKRRDTEISSDFPLPPIVRANKPLQAIWNMCRQGHKIHCASTICSAFVPTFPICCKRFLTLPVASSFSLQNYGSWNPKLQKLNPKLRKLEPTFSKSNLQLLFSSFKRLSSSSSSLLSLSSTTFNSSWSSNSFALPSAQK